MDVNKNISSKCSFIRQVFYSTDNKILDVHFKKNTYRYFNVPPPIFNNFMQAPLPGKYFRQLIRDNFNYKKLS
jgi:hypothetical protein